MKTYIVKNASGKVLRFGLCGDDDLEAQAHEGETVKEATPEEMAEAEAAYRAFRASLIRDIL